MGFKMKGWGGYQKSSPLQRKKGGNRVINGVLCDAYGKPIDPKRAHEADTVNNYKGPGGPNDSNKVAKGLGPAFKYHKPGHKEPNDGNNDGGDDQSKEAARKRGHICPKCDKLKGNCSCPKKENPDKEPESYGKFHKKVMKDGYVNPTQKKKIADEKARFSALTPKQKKAEQDAANAKSKAWRNSAEYKKRKKKTTKDKKTKDTDYQNKKEALLNKGFTQKDADWMIKHGGE
jgi:hypothetical protein